MDDKGKIKEYDIFIENTKDLDIMRHQDGYSVWGKFSEVWSRMTRAEATLAKNETPLEKKITLMRKVYSENLAAAQTVNNHAASLRIIGALSVLDLLLIYIESEK